MQPAIPSYPDFPGSTRLIRTLDDALQQPDELRTVLAMKAGLCNALFDNSIQLPAELLGPVEARYARRELYRCPLHGYSLVAMTWAPGQAAPLHDHGGLWCVEAVWKGRLEVCPYTIIERSGDRFHFQAGSVHIQEAGSVGYLIPPSEYHTVRNPSREHVAISLHVYQRALLHATVFDPASDGYGFHHRQYCLDGD